MKLRLKFTICLFLSLFVQSELLANTTLINSSRENAVRVVVPSLDSSGTGFFIDEKHVVTAFHVVGKVVTEKSNVPTEPPVAHITTGSDIFITLATGENIPVQIVAPILKSKSIKLIDPLPQSDQSAIFPILTDFAILKLQRQPKTSIIPNPLLRDKPISPVGSEVFFSGYPFGTPIMLTHKGIISGITDNKAIICIQAPINKGNSGGALLDSNGDVIGIVTNREGGISKGLEEFAQQIQETQKHGSVAFMGVDPLKAIQELIKTLDKYISPGIGYARNIQNVVNYCDQNPDILN